MSFANWCLSVMSVSAAPRAGTYKIPTANDIPLDLRVTLLADAPCRRTPQAHSSKAVGEPPFFLGASVFFALKVLPLFLALKVPPIASWTYTHHQSGVKQSLCSLSGR